MKAMFINKLTHAGIPYADAIAAGIKPVETRSRDMLRRLMGERVAIVKTVRGKRPAVVGFCDIVRADFCPLSAWDRVRDIALIPPGSAFDCKGRGKWCYWIENAERVKPYPLPENAVRHGRSWCEF